MKEILAFIRMNKINETKRALAEAGYPGMTVRNCLGRGRKSFSMDLIEAVNIEEMAKGNAVTGEHISEAIRLIPKRSITMVVQDDDVEKVVDVIMETNSTGNPGDGKIFVVQALEAFRVRDGQHQDDNDSY